MLFQASLSAPGWAAASQHSHPTLTPQLQVLPTFDVPIGLARVRSSQSPLLSLHRPICEQPRPTGSHQRQGLQVQMASMSPSSASPHVLDGPDTRQDLCQPKEPPESCVHSHAHMEEYLSAGLQGPPFPPSGAFLFHPFSWTLGTLPIATSHPI